ncbi:MAG: aldehyde dehydrogenase family protein [Anaerolineae bacterium]|nr:aldehyde dehydrogenase family protein [Anaerolineae bacterium]
MADQYKMYIGGEWVDAKGGETFDDYNPATGELWAQIASGDRADAKAAVDAAHHARTAWADTPHPQRAAYFLKAADILEQRQQELAGNLIDEAGSWFGKAMFETGYSIGLIRAAGAAVYQVTGEILPSDHGKVNMLVRQPLGVVVAIAPWNFPLLLSLRGIVFAMAVGNTVVLKPSSESPVSGGLMIAQIFEEAGLPPGVLNVVTCPTEVVEEVGDELVVNPKVGGISFTGSSAIGRQLAEKAGRHLKKIALELGGKDPLIVLADADMDRAVNAAVFGRFMHQGQICMSVERIIVEEPVAEEFTKRFVAKAKTLKAGNPREPSNIIGPIINQSQLEKIHDHVTDALEKGATLLCGGEYEGLFYQPTVLTDVTPEMKVYREETFGPVAPVIPVKDVEEAIAVANDSEYGLSAGVITKDEEKGLYVARHLESGMVHINDASVYDEPHMPFGGVKASGIGRHGGKASIEAFTELRWLSLERGGRHYPF